MRRIVLLPLALCACTQFPELDALVSEQAKQSQAPALLPLDQILGGLQPIETNETVQSDLEARIAALRARANRLQGPAIDRATRTRMIRGVQ